MRLVVLWEAYLWQTERLWFDDVICGRFYLKSSLVKLWFSLLSLFPLGVLRAMGACLGQIVWLTKPRGVRNTHLNLKACYPDLSAEQHRRLARQSIIQTSQLALELAPVWRKKGEWIERKILQRQGEDLIESALSANRGLIVLAPHIGNWEVLGRALVKFGDLMNLYQPPKQQYLEDLIKASREQDGAKLVPTNRRGVAQLLKHLKQGGITGILPDQIPDDNGGAHAPFFGIPTFTMTLVHGLIQRSQCRVLFGAVTREGSGFALHYFEPETDIYNEDLQTSLCALNRGVEKCIALAPAQYQWEYKRFKKPPKGVLPFYRKGQEF